MSPNAISTQLRPRSEDSPTLIAIELSTATGSSTVTSCPPFDVRRRGVQGDQQEHWDELRPVAEERRHRHGRGENDHRDGERSAPAPRERPGRHHGQGETELRRRLVRRAHPGEGEGEDAHRQQPGREQPVPDPMIDAPEPIPPRAVHAANRTRRRWKRRRPRGGDVVRGAIADGCCYLRWRARVRHVIA